MNPIDENFSVSDDADFDLLVDGELGEPQRRELLSGLDDEPGGWRRCALAFLEAQSWKQEFGALAHDPAEPPGPSRLRRPFRLSGPAGTLLAMAASFLVALLCASLLQGLWGPGSPAAGPSVSEIGSTQLPPAAAPEEEPAESLPVLPETTPGEVRLVELRPEGQGQSIRLPAVERRQIDPDWLNSLPGPISPELLKTLQQAGLHVEQRRELVPMKMKDGRRLVVPVDEVDIHYVGNPTF